MSTLPLKYRVRAWWEGYDLGELVRRLEKAAAREPASQAPAVRRPPIGPASTEKSRAAKPKQGDDNGWSAATLAAAQIIWGEHSLSPRGDEQLREVATQAQLTPHSRILHIGAELGGTAEVLRRGLGCTVKAAETNEMFANASDNAVKLIRPQDEAIATSCDFILVDGIAERADPLAAILRKQSAGLKSGGYLVLRSLVLSDDRAVSSARYRDWAELEPLRPRLRSTDELSRILQEARLSVRSTRAFDDDYTSEIEARWGDALDRVRALNRDLAGRHLVPVLVTECERWLKRIELIRDGILGVRQFVAVRRARLGR